MKNKASVAVWLLGIGLLAGGPAQATLIDRGGGLLYDDVLNVTWLQDANYAKTSGFDADGQMNWNAANAWAADLVYGGYSDWRLTANTPVGANWNYGLSYNGSTDYGYNITSPNSELSYMYYVNLGLKGYLDTSGGYQPDYGIFGDGTGGDQNDVSPVRNLQNFVYWSGTAYEPWEYAAWIFLAFEGSQWDWSQSAEFYAWAVRPGDVDAVAVAEPGSMVLLGLALGGLALVRRRSLRAL